MSARIRFTGDSVAREIAHTLARLTPKDLSTLLDATVESYDGCTVCSSGSLVCTACDSAQTASAVNLTLVPDSTNALPTQNIEGDPSTAVSWEFVAIIVITSLLLATMACLAVVVWSVRQRRKRRQSKVTMDVHAVPQGLKGTSGAASSSSAIGCNRVMPIMPADAHTPSPLRPFGKDEVGAVGPGLTAPLSPWQKEPLPPVRRSHGRAMRQVAVSPTVRPDLDLRRPTEPPGRLTGRLQPLAVPAGGTLARRTPGARSSPNLWVGSAALRVHPGLDLPHTSVSRFRVPNSHRPPPAAPECWARRDTAKGQWPAAGGRPQARVCLNPY